MGKLKLSIYFFSIFFLFLDGNSFGNVGEREKKVTLILGAYSAPREAFKKIIPRFQEVWKKKTGESVEFQESYLGSGAQSRAIVAGFEADVAVLAMEPDMNRLVAQHLITHNWKKFEEGMVTRSIVVVAVRPGNPKKIFGWNDLARDKVEVLTPNPKTSGGAQWNLLAAYGAARRGKVAEYRNNEAGARQLLVDIFKNVTVLDKGARESIINFERGAGDAAITYESEVLQARLHARRYDWVVPSSTILIENPAAVVDTSVDKHGTREVAEAFVKFLFSDEAQEIFAGEGFRPVDPEVAHRFKENFQPVADLWKIDKLGGWKEAAPKFFGSGGIYDQVMEEVQKE